MARYRGPRLKICRALGVDPWLDHKIRKDHRRISVYTEQDVVVNLLTTRFVCKKSRSCVSILVL